MLADSPARGNPARRRHDRRAVRARLKSAGADVGPRPEPEHRASPDSRSGAAVRQSNADDRSGAAVGRSRADHRSSRAGRDRARRRQSLEPRRQRDVSRQRHDHRQDGRPRRDDPDRGHEHVRVGHRPTGAEHHRGTARWDPGHERRPWTTCRSRSRSRTRRCSSRSAGSCPTATRRRSSRFRTGPRCRKGLTGFDWMFTRSGGTLALYRWIPWVSKAEPFDRPNSGEPFVTPSEPAGGRRDPHRRTDGPRGARRRGRRVRRGLRERLVVQPQERSRRVGRPGAGLPGDQAARSTGSRSGRTRDQAASRASSSSHRPRSAISNAADLLGVAYPWTTLSVVETQGGVGARVARA